MQIVVNCETRLCSQFLGPGDKFFAKLWCDFYGSGSDRIGQSEKFDEYSRIYIILGYTLLNLLPCEVLQLYLGTEVYTRVRPYLQQLERVYTAADRVE